MHQEMDRRADWKDAETSSAIAPLGYRSRSDVDFSPIEDINQLQRWNIKDRVWHLTYNTQTS